MNANERFEQLAAFLDEFHASKEWPRPRPPRHLTEWICRAICAPETLPPEERFGAVDGFDIRVISNKENTP